MLPIIDTHTHLGTSKFSGVTTTESDLLESMERNGVGTSLVMPQPTLENIRDVHAKIAELTLKHPGRFYGIASLDPWIDEEPYVEELEMCVNELGFVAVKLHPMGHNISPLSDRCTKIYESARRLRIPIIVHTGLGTPFSLPSLLIEPARKFPDVTFIVAHAGFAIYTDEAVVAAKACENLILEPSWCQTYTIQKMINAIGHQRLIMGSDHVTNLPVELTKYRSIGLSESQLDDIFHHNAKRIFNIQS
ncbi:amidohydrolase family protein [Cohnella thailandensis]|uniref:Amidohydrolase n=1 Tax=Cohnella thailandensis TaxID=557557 RepID=A0A841T4Q5_9BACL|nr:amidohydrolase family protein [Cohnella thailandensis]MBB6637318.1 amidohydrolase [Cohnella thailandensis]MBP1976646.1 putative TIM-barrel fold metal-dependent hydrolase [Cohnella thailandensis]